MYLADYHTHSAASPDGHMTVSELAQSAIDHGLNEVCVTDHVDTIVWGTQAPRDYFEWSELLQQFKTAKETYGDRLTLRLGAELGEAYMAFDRAEKLLHDAPELDFVIGSVHMAGEQFENFDLYYIEKKAESYYHEVIDSYLDTALSLAKWGRFSVLGHLTLPLRYINDLPDTHMTFDDHLDRCEALFRILIDKGLGIECNTNRGGTPLPDGKLLRLYREMGGEIITLGSDAHAAPHVGCAIRKGQELLRQCGFRYFTTFKGGKPQFMPL